MDQLKVLVTGGAGFIGSHLIELLLSKTDGHLVCLDNFCDYYNPLRKRANIAGFVDQPRVSVVEQSFCDAAAMLELFQQWKFTHVVHLGAYAGVLPSVRNPLIYQQTNVGGTLALLEAARWHPVQRFLLISSSTVYGRGAAIPFVEDAPLGIPMSPYGATKRAAELLGLTYSDLHSVPVVCLRPFSVFGPRLRPDLALAIFTDAIEQGREVPLFGDGTIRRDFTHVSDICRGLFDALTADDVVGEAINLGHAEPLEMREVIAELESALGKKARIDWQPAKPGEMPITFANLRKAERLLKYLPRVRFADGVRDYVDWFRHQRDL